jgi:hypothetical protein
VALVVATAAVGCGGAEHGNARRSAEVDPSSTIGTDPAADGSIAADAGVVRFDLPDGLLNAAVPASPTLAARSYESGECVAYPDDEGGTVRAVPCDQPHDLQITRSVDSPDAVAYPTDEQWTAFIDAACAAPAEALIGLPVDPFGRFTLTAITPVADGWDESPSEVTCAVGAQPTAPSDLSPQLTEDLRGLRDQSWHYAAGDCVSYHYPELEIEMPHTVPCDQPHDLEVTGTVEYAEGFGAPPVDKPDARCRRVAEAYLGGPVPPPWQYSSAPLRPETWNAGRHYTHCVIAQVDPANGRAIEVSASARG